MKPESVYKIDLVGEASVTKEEKQQQARPVRNNTNAKSTKVVIKDNVAPASLLYPPNADEKRKREA